VNRPAPAQLDPDEVVSSILGDVRARRESGFYTTELTQRIYTPFQPYGVDIVLGDLARLETVRPLESGRRFLSPVAVFAKRVIRRLVAWYIRPIAIDQTVFNFHVARGLTELDERLARLEPLWLRPGAAPAVEVGAPPDLAVWRAASVRRALGAAPRGPVTIAGPAAGPIAVELADLNVTVRPIAGNVIAELAHDASAPASVLLLAGVLPMLGANDVIGCVAAAARRLIDGGVMLIDAPLPHPLASLDAAAVDAGFVRWVAPDAVRLVCEAAGLDVGTVTLSGDDWYVLEATKRDARSG
jgi:hypothetical protein